MSRSRAALGLFCLLFLSLACGLSTATPQPAPPELPAADPGPRATIVPFAGTPSPLVEQNLPAANRFAPYAQSAAAPVAMAQETVVPGDIGKVEGLETLDEAQQERLFSNGFVVLPTPFSTFSDAYRQINEQALPVFISSDLILHSFQTVSDVAWQRAQTHYLAADLEALSKAMVAESLSQWEVLAEEPEVAEFQPLESAVGTDLLEVGRRNLAFFSVAARLQDPAFEPPALVSEIVDEELTLIEQGGRFNSPLFRRQEDYAQYAAPPRLAGDPEMVGYHRAMIWLARPLYLRSEDPPAVRQAALQALQMMRAVGASQNLSRWERIYRPAAYFRGSENSWDLLEVQAAAQAVYGDDLQVDELYDLPALDNFIATMHTLPATGGPGPVPAAEYFSFMPGPRSVDDPILRELVFNRVGTFNAGEAAAPPTSVQTEIGFIRGLPRSLDVPAVLGSEVAWRLLQDSDETGYEGYTTQLSQLQDHYAGLDASVWSENYAGALLYGLQPLLAAPVEDGPLFMQGQLWGLKQLNTWHGAWINLRHQTQLAPRPVRAVDTGTDATFAYVEPQPRLYQRLAAQTRQMIDGLEERGLLEEEVGQNLLLMERFLEGLASISRKELAGQRLTEDEMLLLTQALQRATALMTFAAEGETDVPHTDASLPRLVDVYRDEGSGRLLQAALGEAWPLYVLVPRDSQLVLAAGAVFSSYELLGEQLRPEGWQSMEERPVPAIWAQPYLVP